MMPMAWGGSPGTWLHRYGVGENAMTHVGNAGLVLLLIGLPMSSAAADPSKRQPRTVFNDDAQVLREAPGQRTRLPSSRHGSTGNRRPCRVSTFVFLAASTPDICFYDTKAGEEYGARRKTDDHVYIRAMRALKRQGTDALRLVTEHMQAKGKEVLAAIRMSDTHHRRLNVFDELCPQFAIDHPEYVIKQPDGRTNETALDYSIAAVRDHRMGIMKEIITDYPVDGFELNFVRWAKHFPRDQGREKAPIMTRYVEQIRRMMDASGRKREKRGAADPGSPRAGVAAHLLAGRGRHPDVGQRRAGSTSSSSRPGTTPIRNFPSVSSQRSPARPASIRS